MNEKNGEIRLLKRQLVGTRAAAEAANFAHGLTKHCLSRASTRPDTHAQ